jgi:hypothetical protein
VAEAKEKKGESKRPPKVDTTPSLLARYIGEETVTGTYSRYRGLAPANCPSTPPAVPLTAKAVRGAEWTNAKKVLDSSGPEALARWVVAQNKVVAHHFLVWMINSLIVHPSNHLHASVLFSLAATLMVMFAHLLIRMIKVLLDTI